MIKLDEYGILDLTERVKDLEAKVFRSKRVETTRAQQMLLLKHLGLLDRIEALGIKTKKDKAKLLSILLNNDAKNIEEDLSVIQKQNSSITTKSNYNFLVKTFDSVGLNSLSKDAQSILDKIPKK